MRTFIDLTEHAREGAAQGLALAAEYVLEESTRIVPLEEGTLAASGGVGVDEANLQANVSYTSVYAARQHEELTWRHDAGREAKYLEKAGNRNAATVGQIIAQAMREGS